MAEFSFAPEISFEQMIRMDGETLQNLCRVNKYYSIICRDEDFWRRKFEHDFGRRTLKQMEVNGVESWKTKWIHFTYGYTLKFYPVGYILRQAVDEEFYYYDSEEDREAIEYVTETDGIDELYIVKLPLPLSDKEKMYFETTLHETIKDFLETQESFRKDYVIDTSNDGVYRITVYPMGPIPPKVLDNLSTDIWNASRQGSKIGVLRERYPEEYAYWSLPIRVIEEYYSTTAHGAISEEEFLVLPERTSEDDIGTFRERYVKYNINLHLVPVKVYPEPIGTYLGLELLAIE